MLIYIKKHAPNFVAFVFLFLIGCKNESDDGNLIELNAFYTSSVSEEESEEIEITQFAGSELTPSPSCLAVAPTGEVFVGIDMIGSLGKDPGKGRIMKLVDDDNDGELDHFTEFAKLNNPRGIISLGNELFVLHTTFSEETGKATGMNLVVFKDEDNDGIADGPSEPLIENISSSKFLRRNGTDHATNGIRMGIDGWIYIAVGDFGFHDAVDRTGKKLTMLGGGVVRVRPDGTEMEIYSHGTRNTYDLAIDPFMNIFTRGNTNDGGGWNIRFSHHIQSGEYGYPSLFQNFTDEIIPALADVGGGSGTGAFFIDDNSWPDKYNRVPLMADWGRSHLYIHRLTPDGASFKQEEEEFIQLPQITDLDMDASGRMYLAAWDGAGYFGSESEGFIARAVPENWEYKAFPDLKKASFNELGALLKTGNSIARIHAQQELLSREDSKTSQLAMEIATDNNLPLHIRVAGIYTYSQAAGEGGIEELVDLTQDSAVREHALRALADRKSRIDNVPLKPFIEGIKDQSDRVRVAAIIGLGRLERPEAAHELIKVEVPASLITRQKDTIVTHATPHAAIIPAHVAVRSLVALDAVDACIDAIGTENTRLALWALRYMYSGEAVDGLIAAYDRTEDEALKKNLLVTLSRLYKKEAPYDGSWWWGTRPDSKGPFYKGVLWEYSPKIEEVLKKEWQKTDTFQKEFFANLNEKHRMGISEFGEETKEEEEEIEVDLEKIRNEEGQIGKASIEEVMLAMEKIDGDPDEGKAIYDRQGCIACHSMGGDEVMKGPFMGQIGSIMDRMQIAESILKPNASISQGFATYLITTKDEKSYQGFITRESAEVIEIRNIVGEKFIIKTSDILSRKKMETSMMPPGLTNSLSYEEFASLLTYLSLQKE